MSEMTLAESSGAMETPRRHNVVQLFLRMIVFPRQTLGYLRDFGGRNWVWPAGLALVLLFVARMMAVPMEKARLQETLGAVEQQIGDKAQLGPSLEQGDVQVFVGQGASPLPAAAGGPLVEFGVPVAGMLLGWTARIGLVYLFALLLGGRASLGAMARMGLWTTLPDSARLAVTSVAALITGQLAAPGLSALAATQTRIVLEGQGGPSFSSLLLGSFLARLDIYAIWMLALTVIGVVVTARLSWGKGALVTFGYWGLTLVAAVIPPLLAMNLLSTLGGGPGGGIPGGVIIERAP